MQTKRPKRGWIWAIAAVAALAGCGGGSSGDSSGGAASCDLPTQEAWLHDYMADWYYWNAYLPNPDSTTFSSIEAYFKALRYDGSNPAAPAADRWSYVQPTADFQRFFGAGQDMGYGLFVAGQPNDPLPMRVRYIEPSSPAAQAGLVRGQVLVSINGRDPADMKAANDFSVLTPSQPGQQLTVVVKDTPTSTTTRTIVVTAAVYDLTPVSTTATFTSPAGKKVGYMVFKDFIDQGRAPVSSAFGNFVAAGVTELVLDLRYNGGGSVAVSRDLASAIGGSSIYGQRFVRLRYNARHQDSNTDYPFQGALTALGIKRVYVLSGVRTCSASELVINGLKPFVNVVQIGDTSCGKPFGFNPRASCSNTYSAVNFDSVNALDQGQYTSGIAPTCAVADDFDHALGDPAERRTAAALNHMDTGLCPPTAAAPQASGLAKALRVAPRPPLVDDGGRRGMWAP